MTNSLAAVSVFAAAFAALYAAHHIGDYWIQTDHQATHKGLTGERSGEGRWACLMHVLTYLLTQNAFLIVMCAVTGIRPGQWGVLAALLVSGVTHYWADRRWTLEWLANAIPGKANFYRLGQTSGSLGTGAWALDQSFHLLLSVFVPALIIAAGA
jgi:hypothetical protein